MNGSSLPLGEPERRLVVSLGVRIEKGQPFTFQVRVAEPSLSRVLLWPAGCAGLEFDQPVKLEGHNAEAEGAQKDLRGRHGRRRLTRMCHDGMEPVGCPRLGRRRFVRRYSACLSWEGQTNPSRRWWRRGRLSSGRQRRRRSPAPPSTAAYSNDPFAVRSLAAAPPPEGVAGRLWLSVTPRVLRAGRR